MSKSDKQRITEMIQQRIREKEEQERANRPRVPVLKVMFSNAARAYRQAVQLREQLTQLLAEEQQHLTEKQEAVKAIGNMMRQPHTQISIKTDFYASQFIPPNIKEFYRKASNNFLKLSIVQKRALKAYKDKQTQIKECLAHIRRLQTQLQAARDAARKARDEQLVQNMQQRVRYEDQIERGEKLRAETADLNSRHEADAKEYNFKKDNLSRMQQRVVDLKQAIQGQLKKYEQTYNVVTYREYLKKVFDVKLKIEVLEGQVRLSSADLEALQNKTVRLEDSLIRKNSFVRYGPVESLRTPNKSLQRRNNSVSNFGGGMTDRYSSSGRTSVGGYTAFSGKTDRTLSTSKHTRRSMYSQIY